VTRPDGDAQHGTVRAIGAIGLATLLSRVLGYARDILIARTFGAGPTTDAFFVAFRIPNLLRRLFAEGALSTGVVPVLSETWARGGPAAFERAVRAVAGTGVVVLAVASALGVAMAPWIVAVMAPGWRAAPAQLDLAVRLTRIMFPYLALVGLAALCMGVLNTRRRFFTSALSPAVLNVAMILAVVLLASRLDPPIKALAVGVLAGGLAQLAVQLPEVRRLGLPLRPALEWGHPAVRQIARRLGPAVFALAVVQVTVLVNTLLASLLEAGAVSYLYYADRVMEFPLGVFGIALATAALPEMSAQAARGERRAFRATLGFALRLSAFIGVPAAVGLMMLAGPIVRLLFERGEFGATDTVRTAQALLGYAAGLPAFSATRIAAQAFYALGDTRTPVLVSALALGVNVLAAVALMGPLAHAGLAWASSVSAYANLACLCWLLRRRLGLLGAREQLGSLGRTLGASIPLGLWCWWAGGWLGPVAAGSATLAVLGAGALVYAAVAAALGAPELAALMALVRRRGPALPPREGEC
jgi:putative peptidoglycan lipid II flippase